MVAALTAAASASPQRGVRPGHAFSILTGPGESFTAAVRQAALAPGGGGVAADVALMLKRAEAGHAVDVPHGTRNVPATVAELRSALSAARSVKAQPKNSAGIVI